MADLRTAGLLFTASSLCLALLQLTQADNCGVRVQRVAVSGSANLSCAGLAGEERSVTLHKEGRLVHNTTFRGQNAVLDVDQNMRLRVEGHAVVYELRQVTDREAGLYTCALDNMYPPPSKREVCSTALLTVGHCPEEPVNLPLLTTSPPGSAQTTGAEAHCPASKLWVPCLGLAIVFSLVVMTILLLRYKLRRNAQIETVYVNTRRR